MHDLTAPLLVLSVLTLLQWPGLAIADEAFSSYAHCVAEARSESECLSRFGRYAWQPADAGECQALKAELEDLAKRRIQLSWQKLYFNERCHRLGHAHFEADASPVR